MEQPPPLPSAPDNLSAAPAMSLPARLLNVFAVPSEVFQQVKTSPNHASNWVVPMVLLALVGAISVVLMFSQPALMQKVRDEQAKAMDAQIKAGKLTQEQADKVEKYLTTITIVGGALVAIVLGVGRIVWWGFVLWLMGSKALKSGVTFQKTLEVAGLVMMVVVLGMIVALLLTINLSRIGASPGLALMVSDFDIHRKDHLAMGAANIFNFWQVALMSLGLARLAGVPFARAALLVFPFWIVQESLLILIGAGQMAL